MSDIIIKTAKPSDIPQLVSLGYSSFKENDLAEYCSNPDLNKVLTGFTEMIIGENNVVFVKRNDEDERKIDGVLALKNDSLWWSEDALLIEGFFYIKPEVRSFELAKAFLTNAKEYAIINKTPIVMDLFTQKDVEKKKNLLKYMGFKECGSFYIFVPSKEIVEDIHE